MKLHRNILLFLWTFAVFLSNQSFTSSQIFPSSQYLALQDLYDATNGTGWSWSNVAPGIPWNFSNPLRNPCVEQWQGVNCINSTEEYGVFFLALPVYSLNGTLPDSLGDLVNLTRLDLAFNNIFGSIPNSLFSLKQLVYLDLQYNSLTGTFPNSISELTTLEFLNLYQNSLSSSLPNSIGKLKNITFLSIGYNILNSSLPDSLFYMENLTYLELSSNEFTGTLPVLLRNLRNLTTVFAFGNRFYGRIPEDFLPRNIERVDFASNLISGAFPSSIGALNCQIFAVPSNHLTGTIPFYFKTFDLLMINFADNFLNGSIENSFPSSTMITFDMSDNFFTGSLPAVSNIRDYIMSNNYFFGTIPFDISNSTLLESLACSNNLLSGTLQFISIPMVINASYNYFTGSLTNFIPINPNSGNQMEMLVINNNLFTGPIPSKTLLPDLYVLEAGGNYFTGSLPNFSDNLYILAASTNCLSGSLPVSLCNDPNHYLHTIVLNGLSSASRCRQELFPGTTFQSFYLKNYITDGIPACLFRLANLAVLELSGNGLSGKLPFNVTISPTLKELVLSHNLLSGSIPLAFQENQWQKIDLSYNDFNGELSNSFHSYSNISSLTLSNNRLSGKIPSILLPTENIDILSGNMFYCNFDPSKLPKHDPNVHEYSCGSDLVNVSIYFWLGVSFVLVLAYFLLYSSLLPKCCKLYAGSHSPFAKFILSLLTFFRNLKTFYDYFHTYCHFEYQRLQQRQSIIDTIELNAENSRSSKKNYQHLLWNEIFVFWIFNVKIRKMCFILLIFIFIILLPTYIGLSVNYSTYENEYAWSVSGLFLDGLQSGVTLSVELIIFILFTCVLFLFSWIYEIKLTSGNSFQIKFDEKMYRKKLSKSALIVSDVETDDTHIGASVNINTDNNDEERINKLDILNYLMVGFINLILMMFSDVVYVYIIINYNTTVITFAEIALAISKIAWNNKMIWSCLLIIHRKLQALFNYYLNGKKDKTLQDPVHNKDSFNHYDIAFISWNIGLNNLIYPIIAILIVSSNCFNSAFFEPPPVTSSFYGQAQISSAYTINVNLKSSFFPPFLYSYKCSSEIYAYYSPVFIVMLIIETILLPLFKLSLQFLLQYARNDPSLSVSSQTTNIPSLPLNDEQLQMNEEKEEEEVEMTTRNSEANNLPISSSKENSSQHESKDLLRIPSTISSLFDNSTKSFLPFGKLDFFIPTTYNDGNAKDTDDKKNIIFDKNRYVVRFNSYLLILIAYGSIFPPLALIVCISICLQSIWQEMIFGRYLYEHTLRIHRQQSSILEDQLKKDCLNMMEPMKYSLVVLIPISCLLFSYLLFDTFGRTVDNFLSSIPGIILLLIALMIFLFSNYESQKIEALLIKHENRKEQFFEEVRRSKRLYQRGKSYDPYGINANNSNKKEEKKDERNEFEMVSMVSNPIQHNIQEEPDIIP